MSPLEKCPICGVASMGTVHVPIGGRGAGMTMYVHAADLDEKNDYDILEDMLRRVEERRDERDDDDDDDDDEAFCRHLRDAINYAGAPSERSEYYLCISGCWEESKPDAASGD